MNDELVLRVDALELDYDGVPALRDVAFQAKRGERVAIVGANGAGKTTTLRCVARLTEEWRGAVEICGRDARDYSRRELARTVAYLAQSSDALEGRPARRVVELGRTPYLPALASLSSRDEKAVAEALERVDATRFADRPMETLSGGERRKILLAAAFAQEPTLLLLDEPTTYLDYRNQEEISDAIDAWLRDARGAAIETTHDLNRAALRADRVLALRDGERAFFAPAENATRPESLRAIFQTEKTIVVPHPENGVPMTLPRARRETPRDPRDDRSAPTPARIRAGKPWGLLALALAAALAIAILPLVGRTSYPPNVWLDYPTSERPLRELDARGRIFWGERVPKTCLAALAGAGLALAGLALQTLFRNPLATPYTLGIASGSSLGATCSIYFATALAAWGVPRTLLGAPREVYFSALGAFAATALVYALSRRARSQERVLLAGVVVGFFFASLTLCGQYLAHPSQTHIAIHWTTGSLELCEPRYLTISLIAVASGGCALFWRGRALDALALGENRAAALGIEASRLRRELFFLSSALVGVIVAFCGPIGFVGLTAPHAARLLAGDKHSRLVPAAALGGALFLAACHTVARVSIFPASLPVGIVTSLVGGPFFLWLLIRKR